MQKRAVLSGRLSFVHTVYPIFKVHSADFFSNIFFSFNVRLRVGEEIPLSARPSRVIYKVSAHSVRVIKHVSTAIIYNSLYMGSPKIFNFWGERRQQSPNDALRHSFATCLPNAKLRLSVAASTRVDAL